MSVSGAGLWVYNAISKPERSAGRVKVRYRELLQQGHAACAAIFLQMFMPYRGELRELRSGHPAGSGADKTGVTWQALPDHVAEDTLPPGF